MQPVTLTAIPDPGFTFTGWSGDLAGATNPASVMMDRSKTVNAMFAMSTANALAEALDATNLTWSTGGDAPWFGQSSTNHDGIDAAQTPLLTDPAQQSWVRTTVTGPGPLSFWWKFAPSYDDLLEFSIDGIAQTNLSLMSDWQRMTFNVPAGAHVLQWTYHNGRYGEFAFSAAWLDQICFGPDVPCINNTLAAQTVLQGTDVMFTIDATGATPLSYQWQKDGTNLSDGGRISGATSRALTVSNVQTNDDAGIYSVRVSNTFGTATSAASLTVIALAPLAAALDEPGWVWTSGGDAPWFGQTAVSKDGIAAARSGALTFDQSSWVQTTTTGPGKLSFWWKTSSTYGLDFLQLLVSGVTNASISGEVDWVPRSVIIPPGTQTIQWRYIQTFSFTESQETAWLDQITFTPGSPPEITSPPQPQAVAAGANVTFSITATGTSPLAYQWVHDGTNVPGATTTTLNLNSVQVTDAGSYAVIVSNSLGSVISPEAQLTVNGLPVITMQPSSQTARRGGKATFSVAAAGTAPLSYQWQKNETNIIGATPASLTLSDVQTVDIGAYRVIVANLFGSATSVVANLTISLPPTLISQPQSQTVAAGANATFTVAATGDPPLTYQWLFEGAPIAGATDASLTLTNVQAFDAGNYALLVSNPGGSVISSNAVLTVISPPVIFLQPQSVNVEPGETAFFLVGAAGSNPLSYQWRKYDTNLPGANASTLQLTNVQTSDAGPYTVVISNSLGSVTSDVAWLTVGSASLTISITVSNNVASLGWNALAGRSYQLEYKNDLAANAWSNLPPMITATGSNVAVSDFIGNSQRRFYRVLLLPQTNAPPQIVVQPVSQAVSAGANVAFSVTATGSQPLHHQWQMNGNDLPGATAAILSLQNVQFTDTGVYSVVVSNFVDSVMSDAAFLFVQ
ncbi:MAG: hypothetical protein DME23_14170 [Verrucomicrobia bacterium]|nr:MAG: hypothetical protein DME23_14170 [Verrucomicrobiota bacterium]